VGPRDEGGQTTSQEGKGLGGGHKSPNFRVILSIFIFFLSFFTFFNFFHFFGKKSVCINNANFFPKKHGEPRSKGGSVGAANGHAS
jgi:hypothetical protein